MEKLEIPYIAIDGIPSAIDIASHLDVLSAIEIGVNPWPEYVHSVKASYKIAHNGNAIFLRYNIVEGHVMANSTTNQEIHKDSCVEFFVAFGDDECYYNLEFNCLGWSKIAYGTGREKRTLVAPALIELISSSTKIESGTVNNEKSFKWEITFVIPQAVFCFHDFSSFRALKGRANFYKCGVEMPEPHFLAWNMIRSKEPDFHRKEYFAELEFS